MKCEHGGCEKEAVFVVIEAEPTAEYIEASCVQCFLPVPASQEEGYRPRVKRTNSCVQHVGDVTRAGVDPFIVLGLGRGHAE